MTTTATRLALPIVLGDDFPYRDVFFEKLSRIRGNDSTWHGMFLAAWLIPNETLRKMADVEKDLASLREMCDWVCPEEDFDDNPAVDFPNDDLDTAIEKYFSRNGALQGIRPEWLANIVLDRRPGDVTEDGKEVQS